MLIHYIVRRLLLMVPTLVGMTLILFVTIRFAPGLTSGGAFGDRRSGNEGAAQASINRNEFELAAKRRLHMVDENGKAIPIVLQYVYWLRDSLKGDLGQSVQYHVPVSDLIIQTLPTTLALNIISTVITYMIAVPAGMFSAARRGKAFDVAWGVGSLALYSLPTIWIGGLLIGYFANPAHVAWFPPGGLHKVDTSGDTFYQYARDYCWHLALPLIVYTYGNFAVMSKQMRASILDNLAHDYARTARAKGLPGHVVLFRHVFRNSLIPLIVMSSGLLPSLLSGSMVVEFIFSIKGMGALTVNAATARDLPLIQGIALVTSVLSLLSLLLADLAMAVADPRVSYD